MAEMNIPYKHIAPTCVVLAMAIFCCWPYVSQPLVLDASPETTKLRKITDSVFSLVSSEPSRNPFRFLAIEDEPAAAVATAIPKEVGPTFTANDYQLHATMVGTGKSSALINGHFYATGDRITDPPAPDITLVRVEQDRVMIRANGELHSLDYSIPQRRQEAVVSTRISHEAKPRSAVHLIDSMARSIRERHETKGSTLADLLFRSANIANELHGQTEEAQP